MAPKTPVIDRTPAGFVVPGKGVYGGVNAINGALLTNGKHHADRNGFQLDIFHFADIDDTDTWTSNIEGIIAVAWQADQVDADIVVATLTTADTGVITFDAQNTDSVGWLWVLHA